MLVSIRSRMIASHFGMMLLAMLLLAPSSYFLMKYHLQHQRNADLLFTVKHVAGMLDQRVLNVGNSLRQISEDRVVKDFPETARLAAVGEYLGRFRKDFPVVSYLDEKGWEEVKVVNGHRSPYLEDLSAEPLFPLVKKHSNLTLVGSISPGPETGAPMLSMAYGIRRYFGNEFVGALFARTPLSGLTRMLAEIEVGETGYLLLIENSGRILSSPDASLVLQQVPASFRDEFAVKAALNGQSGSVEGDLLGVHGLISYAPLRQLDASLFVVLPYAEFIEGPVQVRNTIFLVLIGISLIGVIGAVLLANRLTGPILDLTQAASNISRGDFSMRIETTGQGEVSQLVDAFNSMTRELRNSTVSRHYFDRIVENMQEGLLLVGLDGKVKNTNRSACALLGMSSDMLLGVSLDRLIVEPGSGETDWLQTLLSDPGARQSEKILLASDGGLPITLLWTVLEDSSGAVKEIACLFNPREINTGLRS